MLLVFCNNYREVQKLNVFSDTKDIPYIEFYIPRKTTDFKICKPFELEKTIEEIKASLKDDEWMSDLNVSGLSNESTCISYAITKEVMYVVPVENSTHKEVKTFINNLIRNNEVIDIDRLQTELNRTKASTISEFAENIIRRI
ncbi:hypothetical protein [uncultured Clostridium sp.]|jgi:hypothetical protein|uniref:hypothetical protein n=1 Tax=uncultured Clostridium sp. TaxID=59620 RepID=UPI0026383362|nr:hypothetical protein [uncultured Clostridium sp.]